MIELNDILGKYDGSKHPDVITGTRTNNEILRYSVWLCLHCCVFFPMLFHFCYVVNSWTLSMATTMAR